MIAFYPLARQALVDQSRVFIGALEAARPNDLSIVIHKTACNGPCTAASVASFFATAASEASTHFIVGLDGEVVQCVALTDGAGGNCCLEAGHDPYWDSYAARYGNLNKCTISIEHVDQTIDNSQEPTTVQLASSFALVEWLCLTFGIPPERIKTHASLDPISKARCPGNYPMASLLAYIRTEQVNSNQQTALLTHWNSFFVTLQVLEPPLKLPPTGTGIYNAWQSLYFNGKQLGPASSYEYDTIDWDGNPVKAQDFGSCRIEYYYSTGIWHAYGPGGQIA